jgi:hypothetical protein
MPTIMLFSAWGHPVTRQCEVAQASAQHKPEAFQRLVGTPRSSSRLKSANSVQGLATPAGTPAAASAVCSRLNAPIASFGRSLAITPFGDTVGDRELVLRSLKGARRYRNIDTERPRAAVSQSLFRDDGVQAELLSRWLRHLPDPGAFEQRDLIGRQCASGALMLVLASVPPDSGALESAGKLLENVLGRSDTRGVLNALAEALAEIGWISTGDDFSICETALEVLVDMSGPEPPVPSEVLAKIQELLLGRNLADGCLVAAYLDRILAIDRGEVAFTSFRQSGGLRAAKGLLLFLLRPDPAAVRTWLDEDINAETEVTALAAMFAGIAHRSTGLPDELRGSDVLQHLLFDWIATGVNGPDIDLPHSTAPVVTLEHRGFDLVLKADGRSALHWPGAMGPVGKP